MNMRILSLSSLLFAASWIQCDAPKLISQVKLNALKSAEYAENVNETQKEDQTEDEKELQLAEKTLQLASATFNARLRILRNELNNCLEKNNCETSHALEQMYDAFIQAGTLHQKLQIKEFLQSHNPRYQKSLADADRQAEKALKFYTILQNATSKTT